ncbi:MAG TPA: response regulator [Chitinophagaceae bacterium]|jgi:signal transduction histidine kinase
MQPKILLVDDREDNLLSMESILEPEGYRFIKASSGRQVLQILLTEIDFALILMDVNMPDLNGFATASLIYEREKLRHIPIIFITANQYGDENIFRGYRVGAVDYIYKPVKPDILRAKVSVFVELYSQKAQLFAQEQKLIAINKNLELEIQEQKSSEEKIRVLNVQLVENISRIEAANKELDLFAFMASHDLQSPLRKIRMFSERLIMDYRDKLDEEVVLYLNKIENGCKQMQLLINDILEFSKIEVKKELFRETNINLVIADVLEEFEEFIEKKKIEVTIDKLPILCVNPVLMNPLFSNLIGNAIKYSSKHEPRFIRVKSELFEFNAEMIRNGGRKNYCKIFIEDNGIGFDQKYAKEIFEMFRRLHPKTEYEGTGIGLALCKKIVEKHHGYLSVKSIVDKGSTFIVALPLVNPSTVESKKLLSD